METQYVLFLFLCDLGLLVNLFLSSLICDRGQESYTLGLLLRKYLALKKL